MGVSPEAKASDQARAAEAAGHSWPGTSPGASAPGKLLILASLAEAIVAADRREVEVTCIKPGLSRNGNYYSRDLLGSLVPLFEGTQAYADHEPSRPGGLPRSVRDLVGYYHTPRVDPSGALRAVLKVLPSADWLWALIQESVTSGLNLVGISIDADGRVAPGEVDGRRCRLVESIQKLNSCDIVSRASAGGRFERLLQADNQSWWDQYEPLNELAANFQGETYRLGYNVGEMQGLRTDPADYHEPIQMGPTIAAPIPGGKVIVGGFALGRSDLTSMGTDAQGAVLPAAPGQGSNPLVADGPEAMLREAQVALQEAQRARDEAQQVRRLLESERLVSGKLSASNLPAPVARKLAAAFANRIVEAAEIDGAIDVERNVLAELTSVGLIRGMGDEKPLVGVGMSEIDKVQRAFDQLFGIYEGEKVPELTGIREAYVVATGDREISGISQPGRLLEADVTTASFAYLLGTSMNKRLLKDYQAWPSEWQKFCTITPIKDFKQQDRIRLGAFGSLSTVPEDTAYTTLTLSDVRATYTPTKRGNLVAVTRETIINDDLYSIKQIPGKLAVSAAFTLAEFIYGFLTATSNIYDGAALFTNAGAHNNSKVVTPGTPNTGIALSSANMQTVVTLMRRQTNMASKPIGLKPRFLVVPPEMEWTAMVITKSAGAPGGNFNDINPMLGYTEVVVAPQLASATFWVLAADPRVIDTIEIGFVGGQVNPVLFVQDQPLYGNNFTNDVITYKVRHEYGGAVVDYRGFAQGNN
jgi:hypothetical protein